MNCRGSSVLQYSGVQGFKTVLQYSLLGSSVLQYIALYSGMRQGCLCCKTGGCVATQRWAGRWAQARAAGKRQQARGAYVGRAGGRCRQLGARARGRAEQAGAQGVSARGGGVGARDVLGARRGRACAHGGHAGWAS